jgi:hypothetical protein
MWGATPKETILLLKLFIPQLERITLSLRGSKIFL